MRRKGVVTILLIGLLVFSVQVSLFVDSFYGYHGGAECSLCHNEPATAWNSTMADESITLDGEGDEAMWDEHNTWGRTMYIPVAGRYGSDRVVVRTTFGQNSSHFFIKADWDDFTPFEGTDVDKGTAADGISFMFNINAENFETCFTSMRTANDGELVDMITWKAGTGVSYTGSYLDYYVHPVPYEAALDFNMDDRGIASDTSSDWMAAGVYGNVSDHHETNYQVEFARPLETGDEYDVQFDKSGYYEFAIALYNGTYGEDHTTSFYHAVWVYNGEVQDVTNTVTETVLETQTTTKSEAGIFGLVGLSLLVLISSAVTIALRRRT